MLISQLYEHCSFLSKPDSVHKSIFQSSVAESMSYNSNLNVQSARMKACYYHKPTHLSPIERADSGLKSIMISKKVSIIKGITTPEA